MLKQAENGHKIVGVDPEVFPAGKLVYSSRGIIKPVALVSHFYPFLYRGRPPLQGED